VSTVRNPGDLDAVNGTEPASGPATVAGPRPHDRRDPWLRIGSDVANAVPLAGQPGHGSTAFLRSQPVRIVDGHIEGGYTDVYELICPGCGDHPYLDHSEVASRLQWLRGPRTLEAALAAYHRHLGLPWADQDRAGSLGLAGEDRSPYASPHRRTSAVQAPRGRNAATRVHLPNSPRHHAGTSAAGRRTRTGRYECRHHSRPTVVAGVNIRQAGTCSLGGATCNYPMLSVLRGGHRHITWSRSFRACCGSRCACEAASSCARW
jgi:hypothetical protein